MSDRSSPRWLRLYFVLAAINLLAVTAEVILGQRLMRSYDDAVATSRELAELRERFLRVGEKAAAVDQTGNDVFASHDL